MCTSISTNGGAFCFGRNMDIEFTLETEVVITPRRYPFSFRRAGALPQHYAMIGAAVVSGGYPLYCDAMNEAGLCMAGLSFPESVYFPSAGEKNGVAPFELIPWVLGSCADITQAAALLSNTVIIDEQFSEKMPLTPLHWHIADKNGSLAVESTHHGLLVHTDPVGVLTNSPPFEHHISNLRQYCAVSPAFPPAKMYDGAELKPIGRGCGAVGLPGDLSSMSRFVRAAFLKQNSVSGESAEGGVMQFFHLLDNVAMPRGSVITEDGSEEYTAYSSCMCGSRYYYKTYTGGRICAADLQREDIDGGTLAAYPMSAAADIRYLN